MTSGRGRFGDWFDDFLDDFILTRLLDARQAAGLPVEQLDVLRANLRSEVLYGDQVRKLLTERGNATLGEMGLEGRKP